MCSGRGFKPIFWVSGAGDINGDGLDDIVIGDLASTSGNNGKSYLVFGKKSFNSTVELNKLNGSNGFKIKGEATVENTSGIHSVSNAGDINGDNIDDLLIGAPAANPNGDRSGRNYVLFGVAEASPIEGTPGNDTLNGTTGDDQIKGLGGSEGKGATQNLLFLLLLRVAPFPCGGGGHTQWNQTNILYARPPHIASMVTQEMIP